MLGVSGSRPSDPFPVELVTVEEIVVVVVVVVVVVFTRETQETSKFAVICKLGGKQFPSALSAVASVVSSTREYAVSDVHVTSPH